MENKEPKSLLNEIGILLMQDTEYPTQDTFLYAELDHNMVGQSVFKELGNQILYREAVNEGLLDVLLNLWENQAGQDRWREMEFVLRDGRFEATYIYPDEIDPDEDFLDRRARAVRRHFGEKPIVYPPWADDDVPDYKL